MRQQRQGPWAREWKLFELRVGLPERERLAESGGVQEAFESYFLRWGGVYKTSLSTIPKPVCRYRVRYTIGHLGQTVSSPLGHRVGEYDRNMRCAAVVRYFGPARVEQLRPSRALEVWRRGRRAGGQTFAGLVAHPRRTICSPRGAVTRVRARSRTVWATEII